MQILDSSLIKDQLHANVAMVLHTPWRHACWNPQWPIFQETFKWFR